MADTAKMTAGLSGASLRHCARGTGAFGGTLSDGPSAKQLPHRVVAGGRTGA